MRNGLVQELTVLAREDDRIVLLTADLGFGVVESFQKEHPNRFFNVGVAEQGMISVATGLAHRGFTPYCYSIATFASLRGLEFVRNGPVAHQLPVRIIGVGPGFDYENDGITHYAVDDIAVMRVQPGLSIWAPGSDNEIAPGLKKAQVVSGPVYIRVARKAPTVAGSPIGSFVNSHQAIAVVSIGDAAIEAVEVIEQLKLLGISDINHVAVSWLDETFHREVVPALQRYRVVVCVENHYIRGGFGSAVLEALSSTASNCAVFLHGVEQLPVGRLGNRAFLNSRFMTDPRETAHRVAGLLNSV